MRLHNHQIKIRQNFLFTYIHVAILYQTANFISTNTFAVSIWDPTAKFNSRQNFDNMVYIIETVLIRFSLCQWIISDLIPELRQWHYQPM